jgi:hypothetical protein
MVKMKYIHCDECGKISKKQYRVDFPNGYGEFCTKKCARKQITRNLDEFIYLINS